MASFYLGNFGIGTFIHIALYIWVDTFVHSNMITKKNNLYKIPLEEVALKDDSPASKTIEFEFGNHDDIFDIIAKMQDKNMFDDKQ